MLTLAALATIALAWDIVQAGHIAQQRRTPRPLGILAGLAVLLAAPALLIAVATSSAITGYSVSGVAWIWPATAAVFVAESMYVTLRRLVTPFVGIPIALYNGLLLVVAVTRYIQDGGGAPPGWALALGAAYTDALGAVAGPIVLASPWATLVPLIAPAFPARHALGRVLRAVVAVVAVGSIGAFVAWWPAGARAVRSYDRYLAQTLQERPSGDFAIGVRILPPLDGMPPAAALRNDLALVDTIGAEAISVTIDPEAVHPGVLDSLAHVLDPLRRDSTTVFVVLGASRDADRRYRASPQAYDARRLAQLRSIVRRLHPDYLVPEDDQRRSDAETDAPLAAGTRYLAAAADSIHAADRHIKVVIAVTRFDERDSALYAWASAPGSPIDAIGFALFPGFDGATGLDAHIRTADRWMQQSSPPLKEQWILAVGGYPAAHGEDAQQLAIWGTLTWATGRAAIKGVIVTSAADYDDITGLRAANGRLRPAAIAVMRAAKELRDRRN
jgi:hypothetical protein